MDVGCIICSLIYCGRDLWRIFGSLGVRRCYYLEAEVNRSDLLWL
jgi:hypothetical protein